jgi:hypothetical protein
VQLKWDTLGGQAYSPPFQGGVAAPGTKRRAASAAREDGVVVKLHADLRGRYSTAPAAPLRNGAISFRARPPRLAKAGNRPAPECVRPSIAPRGSRIMDTKFRGGPAESSMCKGQLSQEGRWDGRRGGGIPPLSRNFIEKSFVFSNGFDGEVSYSHCADQQGGWDTPVQKGRRRTCSDLFCVPQGRIQPDSHQARS